MAFIPVSPDTIRRLFAISALCSAIPIGSAHARPALYFGAGAGVFSEASKDLKDGHVGFASDFIGGIRLNRALAFDLDLGGLSTSTPRYLPFGTRADLGIWVYRLGGTARVGLLDPKFKVFLLAGLDYTEGVIGQDTSDQGSGTSVGLGFSYGAFGIDVRHLTTRLAFEGHETDVTGIATTFTVRSWRK